jgi:hypothetical protein
VLKRDIVGCLMENQCIGTLLTVQMILVCDLRVSEGRPIAIGEGGKFGLLLGIVKAVVGSSSEPSKDTLDCEHMPGRWFVGMLPDNARDIGDFGVCLFDEESAADEYGLIGLDVDHSFVWFHIAHAMSFDVGCWFWFAVLQALRLKDVMDSLWICHRYPAVGNFLNFEACVLYDRVCGNELLDVDFPFLSNGALSWSRYCCELADTAKSLVFAIMRTHSCPFLITNVAGSLGTVVHPHE